MSGLFGAKSPSPFANLFIKSKKTGQGNPGQGVAMTPGQATPTSQPTTPPRAKAKAVKDGVQRNKLRVPYG